MKSQAQVLIIGGGIYGCSLLYHLVQLGWEDVVLVERNDLSAGSTWHAAGLCTHYAHDPTIMKMRAESVRLYKEFDDVEFHACGGLRIARNTQRMDEFRHVQDLGRIAGFDFPLLDAAEITHLHPLVNAEGLLGGIQEPLDGYVDLAQATQAFAKRACAGGAEIYRQNPVTDLVQRSDGSWSVETRNGIIHAEIIVNCAGAWAREIGQMMGVDLPIVPMLHQYLITEDIGAVKTMQAELPILRDPDHGWYTRQAGDGMIVGRYEQPATPWAVDNVPATFGMELLPPDQQRARDCMSCVEARMPVLVGTEIKSTINGPITYSPDGNPVIGPAYGMQNAWVLSGTGMGVMEGGGAGKLLADWISANTQPMDVLSVDSRRFGAYAAREFRIAKAAECYEHQYAIPFPYKERPAARPCTKPPSYARQAALGAQFGFAYGWERANWFASEQVPGDQQPSWQRAGWFDAVAEECAAVQNSAGLFELSAFSKFEVSGPGAETMLDGLGANRPPERDGGLTLTYGLTRRGGIGSEFTVTRLNEDCFYLVSAPTARRRDYDLLVARSPRDDSAIIRDVTEQRGVLALAGPKSREILASLTDADLSNDGFPWLSARDIIVAGIRVYALRVSYVGELGWELHHQIEDQAALYDALLKAGVPHELKPCGMFALNSLRLEKGYRAWGQDLTIEKTPLEAGLHPFVKSEGRGFFGKRAMLERNAKVTGWRMVLLALSGDGVDAFGLHPVMLNGKMVGTTSSGGYGHRVGMSLAFAYIQRNVPMDAELSVNLMARNVSAHVLERVPYDPTNARMRA